MALIDVLIPTYNTPPRYLKEGIQSILAQTIQDIRILVYDDGSKEPAKVPDDPRIVLVRDEVNKGVAFARNRLFDMVEAPYTCFQDADDLSKPTRLAMQMEWLQKQDAHVVRCRYCFTNPNGIPIRTRGKDGAFASSFFVREVTRFRFKQHPETLGEANLWYAQLHLEGIRMVDLPQVLYLYRQHAGNGSWKKLSSDPSVQVDPSELTG